MPAADPSPPAARVPLTIAMIGARGQLAVEMLRLAGPGLRIVPHDRAAMDLSDPAACARAVAAIRADAIVNAAAYTAVDRAEEEPALAMTVNAEAPGAMAQAAANSGTPFLHVSTDYVFDGSGEAPWTEDAPCAPLNAYGRSKLAGERAVAAAGGPHVTLRTSWVHAAHGSNFVRTMLRVGADRARLTVVDDQRGGPTAAADIAAALAAIARAYAAGRGVDGVFHFSGAPPVSWCGFAHEIFAQADWIATPELTPIASADWPTPAARPRNAVLDCRRIAAAYGIAQPNWRRSLAPILAELKEQPT